MVIYIFVACLQHHQSEKILNDEVRAGCPKLGHTTPLNQPEVGGPDPEDVEVGDVGEGSDNQPGSGHLRLPVLP